MSSYLIAAPEVLVTASADLSGIGAAIKESTSAAGPSMIGIAPAAADEVSAAIASLFSSHGQGFQALSAQAATFHAEFVSLLNGGAAQYLSTEIANAAHTLANAVNTPAQALLGHPLIGTGQSNAVAATVVHGGSKLFPTTTTTDTMPYGTGGAQTQVTNSVVLPNLGPLANAVATYVPGSLGSNISSAISGLSGTPYLASTTVSGSDSSGHIVNGVSYTTAGGFGYGLAGNTADGSQSQFISIPGLQYSTTTDSSGAGSISAHVLDTGFAVAVNPQQGIYTGSLQVGLGLSDDLKLGSLTGTVQVDTGSPNLSGDLSLALPLNSLNESLLVNPAEGIYTYSQSGWLDTPFVGTSTPINIALNPDGVSFIGSYPPSVDPAAYLTNLTNGVNFSSQNVAVNQPPADNPFAQFINNIDTNINSLFGTGTGYYDGNLHSGYIDGIYGGTYPTSTFISDDWPGYYDGSFHSFYYDGFYCDYNSYNGSYYIWGL